MVTNKSVDFFAFTLGFSSSRPLHGNSNLVQIWDSCVVLFAFACTLGVRESVCLLLVIAWRHMEPWVWGTMFSEIGRHAHAVFGGCRFHLGCFHVPRGIVWVAHNTRYKTGRTQADLVLEWSSARLFCFVLHVIHLYFFFWGVCIDFLWAWAVRRKIDGVRKRLCPEGWNYS